jgi:hypothetical protein
MFEFSRFDSIAGSNSPNAPIARRFHHRSSFRGFHTHGQRGYPLCADQARKLLGSNEEEGVDHSMPLITVRSFFPFLEI